MTKRVWRLATIATSLIACGRSGLGFDQSSEAGPSDAALGNIEPCPTAPRLRIPECKDAILCEYNGQSIVPLCRGYQECLADGGWRDTRNSLPCPAQEQCPRTSPSGPCTGSSFSSGICSYPDAGVDCICASCGSGPAAFQWECFAPPATCLARPQLGTACNEPGAICKYPPSCCTAWVQKCDRGVWVRDQPTRQCAP